MTLPEGPPGENNGITWANWKTYPWQMWSLSAILLWSFLVLINNEAYFMSIPPSELNNPRMLNIMASAVFVGSLISLIGLHMKDREFGVWAEASGYIVLIGLMGFNTAVIFKVIGIEDAFSRLGTVAIIGYICAMSQRIFQIVAYQISRWRVIKLEQKIDIEASRFSE